MVNTGRPSGRCLPCKEDKTKCDLKKPLCGRCVRLRKDCGGYPDQWHLIHRQQDQIAAHRVQSRVTKRRAERKEEQRASEPRESVTATSSAALASPAMPRPFDVAFELYCIPQLFSDYSSNSGIAIYDALPALTSAGPASCYSHALIAVAAASSSGFLCQPRLLTRARVSYGLAMSNLQRVIVNPEPLRDNSVLATLFLLGFFEVVTQTLSAYRLKTVELKCDPHSQGGRTLIQYRINNGLDTMLDQKLFVFTRNVRLMQVFMTVKSPTSLLADFIDPFAAWEHLPPLEPIIMESVLWIADLDKHIDLGPSCDGSNKAQTVSVLIDRARNLIFNLLQVAESISTSPENIHFNGFIAVRTQTAAAMARSHYRTVALHVMDMAVSFLRNSSGDKEGEALGRAMIDLVNWEALRKDLHAAVFGSPDDPAGTPMAVQALSMAWPMMATTQSKIAPLDVRLIAQESLGYGAKLMHIVKP